MDLMTPTEFLDAHPEVKEHWTVNDIGVFRRCKLISGKLLQRRQGSVISEKSALALFDYLKNKLGL